MKNRKLNQMIKEELGKALREGPAMDAKRERDARYGVVDHNQPGMESQKPVPPDHGDTGDTGAPPMVDSAPLVDPVPEEGIDLMDLITKAVEKYGPSVKQGILSVLSQAAEGASKRAREGSSSYMNPHPTTTLGGAPHGPMSHPDHMEERRHIKGNQIMKNKKLNHMIAEELSKALNEQVPPMPPMGAGSVGPQDRGHIGGGLGGAPPGPPGTGLEGAVMDAIQALESGDSAGALAALKGAVGGPVGPPPRPPGDGRRLSDPNFPAPMPGPPGLPPGRRRSLYEMEMMGHDHDMESDEDEMEMDDMEFVMGGGGEETHGDHQESDLEGLASAAMAAVHQLAAAAGAELSTSVATGDDMGDDMDESPCPSDEEELEEGSGDRNDPDREQGHGNQRQRPGSRGNPGKLQESKDPFRRMKQLALGSYGSTKFED